MQRLYLVVNQCFHYFTIQLVWILLGGRYTEHLKIILEIVHIKSWIQYKITVKYSKEMHLFLLFLHCIVDEPPAVETVFKTLSFKGIKMLAVGRESRQTFLLLDMKGGSSD